MMNSHNLFKIEIVHKSNYYNSVIIVNSLASSSFNSQKNAHTKLQMSLYIDDKSAASLHQS